MRPPPSRVQRARDRLAGDPRVVAARTWWEQSLYGRGFSRVRELDLDTHALALGAQQVVCTAPLVVALSGVLQRETGRDISVYIARFFGLDHTSTVDLARLFGRSSDTISTPTLIIALITAVIFMTSVGAVQQRAFEMIWTLPRISGVRSYLRQLLFAPAVAVFTVAVLGAGRIGHWVGHHVMVVGPWSVLVMQAAMTFLFYWWAQFWLLNRRVTWRALRPGAVAVAVLTTIQVRISRIVVSGQISWQVHAYGLVGAVFILAAWLMILSAVIFLGVLFGALFTERRADPARPHLRAQAATPLTPRGLDAALPAAGTPCAPTAGRAAHVEPEPESEDPVGVGR